jgi:hypothetical protein
MSRKKRLRLEVFGLVKRGEITLVRAAQWLNLSERQARRIRKRYLKEKDAGLVHRSRGRRQTAGSTTSYARRSSSGTRRVIRGLRADAREWEAGRGRSAGQRRHAGAASEGSGRLAPPASGAQAPQPPRASRVLRRNGADGRLAARLVRGPGASVRADGPGGRCHEPDSREVLKAETTTQPGKG